MRFSSQVHRDVQPEENAKVIDLSERRHTWRKSEASKVDPSGAWYHEAAIAEEIEGTSEAHNAA